MALPTVLQNYAAATPEEKQAFRAWLAGLSEEEYHQLLAEYGEFTAQQAHTAPFNAELLELLNQRIDELEEAPVTPMRRRWPRIAVAAAVLFLLAGGAYWFLRPAKEIPMAVQYKGDVAPGHDGAVLHLSDGRTIVLDSAHNGTLATEGKVQAVKEGNSVKYFGTDAAVVYNTITTDKGRQWQLTLPDGTKVWLNAASSIRYPLTFTGQERKVEVTGEAYFEVVHNALQPFRVQAGDETIEDIGTAFNINAYTDEAGTKTTLVEGSVKVSKGAANVTLQPGEQAQAMQKSEGNIELATAWRKGLFGFEHTDLQTVMRQVSRWYNVDVHYEGAVPAGKTFTGEMGRDLTLAQVLKGLQALHVHFKIEEDKRILIMP